MRETGSDDTTASNVTISAGRHRPVTAGTTSIAIGNLSTCNALIIIGAKAAS